jgi:hypothetical protein
MAGLGLQAWRANVISTFVIQNDIKKPSLKLIQARAMLCVAKGQAFKAVRLRATAAITPVAMADRA